MSLFRPWDEDGRIFLPWASLDERLRAQVRFQHARTSEADLQSRAWRRADGRWDWRAVRASPSCKG